jgi:hypothetical protein
MVRAKHLLVGAGALAAIYFGRSYLLKLNRLSTELETEARAYIHKVNLTGIELSILVKLKNPSGGSLKVKHPFVKLVYQDKTLASSQVKDSNITIDKFSEVNLDPIKISLSFLNLATTVPTLLKAYRETGKLDMVLHTVTTINDSLPFSKTEMISLGGGKQA